MSEYDLVPTQLAIQAMRDNGYKNTAYALAELMDNSIQAGAKSVSLLCSEVINYGGTSRRANISRIAVLDDGSGMTTEQLQAALQFGNGAYLKDHSGIGRFGMGLPSSSISQCRRTDVWTWQAGIDSAVHSFLSLDDIEAGELTHVPTPTPKAIPKMWIDAAQSLGSTGTLVVWSMLDRCLWKTARAVIGNSEEIIARVYRKFLHDGDISIRLASFMEDKPATFTEDRIALPNDPGYLMAPSSTPAPYHDKPMFRPDGDNWEEEIKVELTNGNTEIITIRSSHAKEEAREGVNNPGSRDYGQHAKRNIGVSLVRAGRELELDKGLLSESDRATERWWGLEIEFPPTLDNIFGVTNNKQSARNFADVAQNLSHHVDKKESLMELRERMTEDEDPQLPLLEVIEIAKRRISHMQNLLKLQTKNTRSRSRHEKNSAEARATAVTKQRQDQGYVGQSDSGESMDADERTSAIVEDLEDSGVPRTAAEELAVASIIHNFKYIFAPANLEGHNFFTVSPAGGELLIKINVRHPAYENLVELLDDVDPEIKQDDAIERLSKARDGLRLLLSAWARLEDEARTEGERADVQEIRHQWGRYAAQFLKQP